MGVGMSGFILLATRGHDMLYSDWGEKILHGSVHHVYSYFRVLCTTAHVLLSYRKLLLFQLLSVNFCEFNFHSSLSLRKYFNNEIFPNYGAIARG